MVHALERRVSAAVALGFRKVVAPRGAAVMLSDPVAKHVTECGNVTQLKRMLMAKGGLGISTNE